MGEQGSESALSRGLKKAPATTVSEQAFLGGREVPPAIPIPRRTRSLRSRPTEK